MKRRMRMNPDWTDYVLNVQWDEMERAVGSSMMPSPKQVEEGLKRFAELGCGRYGCVFGTQSRNLVLKLTADPSEAAFVAAAIKIGHWPDGIVRYKRVFALPDELAATLGGNNIWAIWREAAVEVGLDHPAPQITRACGSVLRSYEPLSLMIEVATDFDNTFRGIEDKEEALRHVSEMLEECNWDPFCIMKRYSGYVDVDSAHVELAKAASIYVTSANNLGATKCMRPVGESVIFYASHGMMMGDLNLGNIGLVRRGKRAVMVITDPGVMLPLRPDRLKVAIDRLPQVERAAANPRGRH